jgi:hypothetical protein
MAKVFFSPFHLTMRLLNSNIILFYPELLSFSSKRNPTYAPLCFFPFPVVEENEKKNQAKIAQGKEMIQMERYN